MIYNGATGAGVSASAVAPAASSVACRQFTSANGTNGVAIPCPVPPSAAGSGTNSASGVGTGATSPTYVCASLPCIYPPQYPGYRIEIDAATQLMLYNRTGAALSDFAAGDQINVFGYYNTDGSIQAYLIRDLSKPVQTQTLQLNNVQIISISGTVPPVTIAVTQEQTAPCYSFNGTAGKMPYACPMGISSFGSNAATQNVTAPAALMPSWAMLHKYVVTLDPETIILDANRTRLSLSDLRVGDLLNVYGETMDNGQTVIGDIIRDLSIPATPQTFNGTVTQVNADGSFVFQTNAGQTITVQSPIQVGAALQLTGLLDRLQNVLSQVSSIVSARNVIYPPVPLPVPMSTPGMLRVQGGSVLPPTASGTPNTQN